METVLTDRREIVEDIEDDKEFEWQKEGQGKPPVRKRMLCFTLRRLMRLRLEPSFRNIEESNLTFLAQWSELKRKGQSNFVSGLMAVELKKQKQRQTIRTVLLR